jgi:hypothetical protein
MSRRDLLAAACGAVVAGVLAGGFAWAAIPDTAGVVHTCYSQAAGTWRPIDFPSQKCKQSETMLVLSQKGPKGDTGPTGPQGATGPTGPSPAAGTSCPSGEFVTGFDAAGAIVCGTGSSGGGGGSTDDADADGRPDSVDPCPLIPDTVVGGVRYCPATVYDVNNGTVPAGAPVCLVNVLVTGVSGTTATLAIDPGDPNYAGPAGSTIDVDFGSLPPTPSTGQRVTVCGAVVVGPGLSPTQVTVVS